MKRGKKHLLGGLAVVAVAALFGVVLLITNLTSLVKTGVEDVGQDATQTVVRLRQVGLLLLLGRGELRDLTIGNPDGFASEYAFVKPPKKDSTCKDEAGDSYAASSPSSRVRGALLHTGL